ncbi:MAG: Gfo/Idh/MocA family oxidoreductase, partial [Caldilineaceae bacterium]|nr:Gfo/Idh/MocA family oxidoreductase [Caldilineaceae bacterium]
MSTTLNLGLIGAGRIGRVHAESLTRRIGNVHLRAVTDLFTEAAQTCAKDFQIPHVYTDHRAILDDPQIDAVVICS